MPNGLNFQEIKSSKPSKKKFDILFSGRLVKEKRVDLLLHSISLLKSKKPKFSCVIIGEGPERKNLEFVSSQLGLSSNVSFLGQVPNLYSFFKSSKIFVLPSSREGFGLSLLEASACGVVPVTLSFPENASVSLVQNNKTGFISKPNPEALFQRLLFLLSKPSKRSSLAKAAKAQSKNFSWNNIVEQLETVYSK